MLKQSVKAKNTYNGFIFELKDGQKKKCLSKSEKRFKIFKS